MTDEELSRWIAEFLEPAPPAAEWMYSESPNRVWLSHRPGFRYEWKPRDMVNDPAMTLMLLEKLREIGILTLMNGLIQYRRNMDLNKTIEWREESLGRAVAEAFALANGWKQ